ncbi:MAG: FAD binding domain-containing protein [Anaerolineae bacterium]
MATDYRYPGSVEEAIECLEAGEGAAWVIAGGTDVLPDIRKGAIAPQCLVDVTRIPELRRIEIGEDLVTVGATVTFAVIRGHPFLTEHVHALVEAARSVGAGPIQNVATWVGNIVQGMPAADGAVVAIALDAEACIVDRDGARWQAVESLFAGPGVSTVDPTRQIVTAIRFPRPDARTGTAWRRVGRRSALVLPILNCAVRVELAGEGDAGPGAGVEDGRIADVAIALGPVAPVPFRARKAEGFLRGRAPRREILEQGAQIARDEANPRTSAMRASRGYRLEVLPVLVTDALATAVGRGGGPSPQPSPSGERGTRGSLLRRGQVEQND